MTENVGAHHRAWMGLAFNMALPVGMLYLSGVASFYTQWRDLQVALCIPGAVVFVVWL